MVYFRRALARHRQEETVWMVLSKERRMPPNYDSAARKDSVPKKRVTQSSCSIY